MGDMKHATSLRFLAGAAVLSVLAGCALDRHAGSAVASSTPTCKRAFEEPGPPPGGFGPACVYQMSRGFKDGSEGYFVVTLLLQYANGVLIDVQDFERFIPDDRFGAPPEKQTASRD